MDVFEQQKKLYSDPHFGDEKRGLMTKLFESVKSALTPEVVRGADAHSFQLYDINQTVTQKHQNIGIETYTIFRNGIHHETFSANECACKVEIIALKKQYPHDDWTFVPGNVAQPKKRSTAAA